MKHSPTPDNLGISTSELICCLVNRLDAPSCLHSLLALMVVMSDGMPIDKQYRMAATLRDAAEMIQERLVSL